MQEMRHEEKHLSIDIEKGCLKMSWNNNVSIHLREMTKNKSG